MRFWTVCTDMIPELIPELILERIPEIITGKPLLPVISCRELHSRIELQSIVQKMEQFLVVNFLTILQIHLFPHYNNSM